MRGLASPHAILGAMPSLCSCWPSSSSPCRSIAVALSSSTECWTYSYDTETATHCENCAAAQVLHSAVLGMVPDASVTAPRHVPWWSAVLVFDDGYGMFMVGFLVSSFRAVFPFVVAMPEMLGILGRYGPEGQLCCEIVDALSSSSWTRLLLCLLCKTTIGLDGAVNCGVSAVAVHRSSSTSLS